MFQLKFEPTGCNGMFSNSVSVIFFVEGGGFIYSQTYSKASLVLLYSDESLLFFLFFSTPLNVFLGKRNVSTLGHAKSVSNMCVYVCVCVFVCACLFS